MVRSRDEVIYGSVPMRRLSVVNSTPCLGENKSTRQINEKKLPSCVVCGQMTEIDRYLGVFMPVFKEMVFFAEKLTRVSL